MTTARITCKPVNTAAVHRMAFAFSLPRNKTTIIPAMGRSVIQLSMPIPRISIWDAKLKLWSLSEHEEQDQDPEDDKTQVRLHPPGLEFPDRLTEEARKVAD